MADSVMSNSPAIAGLKKRIELLEDERGRLQEEVVRLRAEVSRLKTDAERFQHMMALVKGSGDPK